MNRIITSFVISLWILFSYINVFSQIPEGGTDIIKEATGNYFKVGKGTLTLVGVENQTFSQALRFVTPANIINPWDEQIKFQSISGIESGDILLVCFYARTTSSSEETGEGLLNVVLENKTDYAKIMYQNIMIGPEWKAYYAPIMSNSSIPVSNLNCAFFMGFSSQTIELADIRFINYAKTRSLEEMPVTEISYFGREADAPWRSEATARIDLYRKGDMEFTVLDTFGNPVPGAEVKLQMKQHLFRFGSAIVASEYLSNSTYKKHIHDLFNEVVFENDLKWPTFLNKSTAQKNELIQIMNELNGMGITVRGHNVQWPSWKFSPTYLASYKTNPDRVRLEIDKHIDNICSLTRGKVVDWDVINEPYSEHDFMDILGRDVMADWFKRVRNNDPYVKLFLNDYSILSSNGTNYPKQDFYIETCRFIDELGGGVQGIGMQGHFGGTLTPITRLKTVLDKFSVLGKEIKVTEFDIDISQEAVQADYTRDFYTMLFSHPSVTGILMWGFWESRHWLPNGAMYKADWSIKPNGMVYKDLVFNKWWTKDTVIITDNEGKIYLNGFLGKYSFTVNYDGEVNTGYVSVRNPVSSGISNQFTLSIHPQTPAQVEIKVAGDKLLCEGNTTQLSVSIAPEFEVNWYKAGIGALHKGPSYTTGQAGLYYAEVSGKGIKITSDTIHLIVNPIPEAKLTVSGNLNFCSGAGVNFRADSAINYTYKWFKDGIHTRGSLPEYYFLESGTYKVEINSLGCKSNSEAIKITKLTSTDPACSNGIEVDSNSEITAYPNPFEGTINIHIPENFQNPVVAKLIDIQGKSVSQYHFTGSASLSIPAHLPKGYYSIVLQTDENIYRFKMFRE